MMKKTITVENAIKTAWMILNGLGYSKDSNSELAKTVEEVFQTCPSEKEESE